ncbi:hypothetical protein NESM_000388100 [Novymonas esmeraldas]|uniref:Uncharacterized protein n=1 Tax=Novymonas esmeraldas TaxID=1808958 RepID=A0AAW0EP35_9TRYP
MLPYGALWRLDQMLHPAGPPQRRTPALRRRQALFYFLWAVALVSVFLFPFHYASLRRMRIAYERELLGLVAPAVDLEQLRTRQELAAQRLRVWTGVRWVDERAETTGGDAVGDADVSTDFALAFLHHPSSRTRLDGVFAHPYVRALAGGGAGALWARLGDSTNADGGGGGGGREAPQERRARTLSDAAVEVAQGPSDQRAGCLIALRRDVLLARAETGDAAGRGDMNGALQTVLSREAGKLRRIDGGPPPAEAAAIPTGVGAGDVRAATEAALATLLLWLTSGHTCSHAQEEAISRSLAACSAPLSRSLRVTLEWVTTTGATPTTSSAITAATHEEQEATPQYVCLCRRGSGQPPAALVERGSGTATPLYVVDPARLDAEVQSCADACQHGG